MDARVVLEGGLGSLAAGLCTGLGAVPVLFRATWSRGAQVAMLSIAAGVMLGATVFSLLVPALALVDADAGGTLAPSLVVGGGTLLGALAIWIVHELVPHDHFVKGHEGRRGLRLGRNWLFVLAITLHNFPEGMSVGVAWGADRDTGLAVAIGIALQNLPEGLAVAAALISDGFRQRYAFAVALLTGLIEPLGGLLGAAAATVSAAALPWTLSAAAGAMLFIISGEIIPETHRQGAERKATLWLVAGFVVMMILDVALA